MATATTKKTTMKKAPTTAKPKATVNEDAKINENTKNDKSATVTVSNTDTEKQVKKAEPKKFEPTDGIECKSITTGGLYMEGIKSHITYEWADAGDITEVEYQDLLAAVRSNSNYITKPFFIIIDQDFLAQHKQIDKIYETMYSYSDLRDVLLQLDVNQMTEAILSFPDGAKESIKNLASQLISNGMLDSVQKIKKLDEIFDTELMLMTGLFN